MRAGRVLAGWLLTSLLAGAAFTANVAVAFGAAPAPGSETCSTQPPFAYPKPQLHLGGGQLRMFALQHRQCLGDMTSYDSIYRALDNELTQEVDPFRSTSTPNFVEYTELTGLMFGVEGSRGKDARDNADTLIKNDQAAGQEGTLAIAAVAAHYLPEYAYYFGPGVPSQQQEVQRLFTAITDTVVRGTVENASALAKKHHVYINIGAPLPVLEGAACTGQFAGWPACPGWDKSTAPADRCALGDPDLATPTCLVPYVYVARTTDIANVQLVFAPDGTLYDLQPKVNLTPTELGTLGWHQASATTIHAIQLYGADRAAHPEVRVGIGISLDGFEGDVGPIPCPVEGPHDNTVNNPYPRFMQCLDSKGVNVFIQPDYNNGGGGSAAACMSWTDFTEDCAAADASWQPLSWMRSTWRDVQGRAADGSFLFPHIRYGINTFLVGNLFDIAGDGQGAIISRYDPRAVSSWYSGDSADALYNGAGVGVYTDRADDPRYRLFEGPQPGFLALTPWVIAEGTNASRFRVRTIDGKQLVPGDPRSLRSCEVGMAPGSGVAAGRCSENSERPSALVADLDVTLGPDQVAVSLGSGVPTPQPSTANGRPLPPTGTGLEARAWFGILLLGLGLLAGLGALRRRRALA